jgi:hypothetical protein
MPLVGFEPTISVFQRTKVFHVLDRVVTVMRYCTISVHFRLKHFDYESLIRKKLYKSLYLLLDPVICM